MPSQPEEVLAGLATFEFPRVLGSELPAPLPDGLVGKDDPPLRQEFLNVAKAQGKPMVLPNAMADDCTKRYAAHPGETMLVRYDPFHEHPSHS